MAFGGFFCSSASTSSTAFSSCGSWPSPAERAEMDSQADAVGWRGVRAPRRKKPQRLIDKSQSSDILEYRRTTMTATAKPRKLPTLTPLEALEQAAECLKT